MKIELRYAGHPNDVKNYDTEKLRKEFLVEKVFTPDEISLVYSMYDRYMAGGAMPVRKQLKLETPDELKAEHFLDRRELGIINVGGNAEIYALS
jgi:4-deoxy-L-threo-5-hexosulose-uronate ketol-isomerase